MILEYDEQDSDSTEVPKVVVPILLSLQLLEKHHQRWDEYRRVSSYKTDCTGHLWRRTLQVDTRMTSTFDLGQREETHPAGYRTQNGITSTNVTDYAQTASCFLYHKSITPLTQDSDIGTALMPQSQTSRTNTDNTLTKPDYDQRE